jgi:phosphoglycolate phosphatase-like HAD superfamily hydrolase
MIKNIHIFDMDGTIVSSLHRYRTDESGKRIDLDYWRENDIPEKIEKDSLLPHAAQYEISLKDPETYVIIATARAATINDANYEFICRHLGLPDKFIHREGENDSRGGAELKIAGIKKLLNLKQFRKAAITIWEDNEKYLKDMVSALGGEGKLIFSQQRY